MQAVKEAMGRRGQDEADIGNKGYPAEQGIGWRKYLSCVALHLRHRPHAA